MPNHEEVIAQNQNATRRSVMVNAFSSDDAARLAPGTRALVERRERVLGSPYRLFYREPVHAVRGEAAHLFDAEGKDYLDAYNNVPAVGHSNAHVHRLVGAQLQTLNTHTRYLTDGVVDYAERLTAKFPDPLSQAIFACTGSEAVDLALRIAKHATGGEGIIITRNAYHGTTKSAAEISPSLGAGNPIPDTVAIVDAPDPVRERPEEGGARFTHEIEAAIAGFARNGIPFAGMIVDSVLSSDGVRLTPTGFLAQAAAIVRAAGGLYIADEVQPGFGRTGDWWGFERHDFTPDLVVLGKPMGNGMPISAVVGSGALFSAFGEGVRYFNTFGGNPVSIAAATAVLDEIERLELRENATRMGARLTNGMREAVAGNRRIADSGRVADIRGAGLFLSVEFVLPGGEREPDPDPETTLAIVNGLRDRRILVSASGTFENVLKIRPPLVFTEHDAERFLDGFDGALRDL